MSRPFYFLSVLAVAIWLAFSAYANVFAVRGDGGQNYGNALFAPTTPTPTAPRRTPTPPTPPAPSQSTSQNRLSPLSPSDLLTRCGWSAGSVPLTLWQNAKVSIEIPSTIRPNVTTSVVIRFQFQTSAQESKAIRTKLALCPTESAVQVIGQRTWELPVIPGQTITVTANLRFNQSGEFDLYTSAYDPTLGRIAGGTQRVGVASQVRTPSQTDAAWQQITTEGFEGIFPSTGWTVRDLSNDGYERYWDDAIYWDGTAYRAHSGYWAAWPARGGADGYSPSTNNNYSNNMDTRMVYGPFDLSNAVYGYTRFWLWRDMEQTWDWVALEASHTGNDNDFQELSRWTGSSANNWEQPDAWLTNYVGDNSVWLAWRFHSDYSITAQGTWVDEIEIWKYVPGQVTVRGSLFYTNRTGGFEPASSMKVYLWDHDANGSDDQVLPDPVVTDANGFFQFSPVTNWDYDDSDPDTRLDLYVVWQTDCCANNVQRYRVTDISGNVYWFPSDTRNNVADGVVEFNNYLAPPGTNQEWATRLLQDNRRAWEYIWNSTNPHTDPGSAIVRWENGSNCYNLYPLVNVCSSFFWPFYPLGGEYITDVDKRSSDVVIHELGHQYMYNAFGWWFWGPDRFADARACFGHQGLFNQYNELCAWTEGWAEFFPIAVNFDPQANPLDTCYDWGPGPCGANGFPSENIETRTWPNQPGQPDATTGHTVEGRVAGALFDLYDNSPTERWDTANFGFVPIWNIVRTAPNENSFAEFWNSWKKAGNNKHVSVQAIYQNTIDYDSAPRFDPLLPDLTVLQGTPWNHAIDLWAYSKDDESASTDLGWQILNVTDARCGVSIDANRYVNLAPQQGWLGSCDVTVSVSDGIKAGTDIFRVTTVPVASRIFLPMILK